MKLRLLSAAHAMLLALGILSLMGSFVFVTAQSAFAASLQNDAMVRVVHAAPGAGMVDVFVDGNKLLSNFAFSFKLAAVAGVPGMPNTGSDPNAVPANQSTNPWLPFTAVLAFLLIGSSIAVRRYALARHK